MIARVFVTLPFALTVPEGEVFSLIQYDLFDYKIVVYPPIGKTKNANNYSDAEKVTLNSKPSYFADLIQIDFIKNEFDRSSDGDIDPPVEVIKKVTNDALSRLRYVLNSCEVKSLPSNYSDLSVYYLKDDETEFEQSQDFVRSKFIVSSKLQCLPLTQEIWDNVNTIVPFSELPTWKVFLFDAESVLPHVGPAIILVFTSLEVFISNKLDEMASTNNVDIKLWKWINSRQYLKAPSIDEQFDFLSLHILGFSIKSDNKLWLEFKNLQKIRNNFAHTGICKLDNQMLTEEDARYYISIANKIIDYFKSRLPKALLWPEFKNQIEYKNVIPIRGPEK